MDLGTQVQPASDTSLSQDRGFAVYLMEHLVVPAFVIDTQCKVLNWNKACERLTGVAAQDMVGTSERTFWPRVSTARSAHSTRVGTGSV